MAHRMKAFSNNIYIQLCLLSSLIVSGCNPFQTKGGNDDIERYAVYNSLNPKISVSISIMNRAGSVTPTIYYQDDVFLLGRSILLNRSGGSGVVLGSWVLNLTSDEVNGINSRLTLISIADSDILSDEVPIGGGSGHVYVGSTLKFYYGESGLAGDNKYHQYTANVQNLNDYIYSIILSRGYGVTYIGNT